MKRENILNYLRSQVSLLRFKHCLGVEEVAVKLAPGFGVKKTVAATAALLHDVCREYSPELLLKLASKFDILIDDIEREEPLLLHGFVGSALVRSELGIDDPDILEAISYHITGNSGLAAPARLLFAADFIEPGRTFPIAKLIREEALQLTPDQLLLKIYNFTLHYVIDRGYLIHPRSVAGRNEILKKGIKI